MRVTFLSVSRARTYIQCSFKYSKNYPEDEGQEPLRSEGEHLEIGTVLHSTFERIYRDYDERVDVDTALAIFQEEFTNNPKLKSSEHFKHGVEMVRTFANTDANFVFPILEVAEGVPALELEFFVDLEEPGIFYAGIEEASEAAKAGRKILRGFIDKVFKVDDETLMIVDYKTGWVVKSQAELEMDEQLHAYNLAARTLFPEFKNVIVTLNFIRHDKPVFAQFTAEDAEIYRKWFLSIFDKIKADEDPKPTKNEYCWCCEARFECPLYQAAINTPYEIPDFDDDMDRETLWNLYKELSYQEKIVAKAKKEIDEMFRGVIERHNLSYVAVGEHEIYLSPNKRSFYPLDAVAQLVPIEEVISAASISNERAEKLVAAHAGPEGIDVLKESQRRYYQRPTLRERKKK